MKNTLENKARFFALYWGQNISCVSIYDAEDRKGYEVNLCDWKVKHEDSYLELAPLSLITDEDLVALYHLYSAAIAYDYTMDFKDVLTMAKHWRDKEGHRWENNVFRYSSCSDYLRTKGYAVPWLNLTVEQQIKYGWIKLREN